MAQTRKKRRSRHAGTQAGTVERRGRTSKPSPNGKKPAQSKTAAQRPNRLDQPPTWRGAVMRAAASAVIFALVVIVAFRQPPLQGASLGAAMFLLYIPLSYLTDRFLYNRRQRQQAKQPASRSKQGQSKPKQGEK
jgi:hypothetical protein